MTTTDRSTREQLIDAVARQMTDVEPSRRLRPQVLARLDKTRPRPWFPIALAGCAATVLMVVVLHREPTGDVINTRGALTSAANAPQVLASGGPSQSPILKPQAPRLKPVFRERHTKPAGAASAEELAWQTRAIPALEQPDALAFAEIQPAALEVRPLITAPLNVPAIGENDR